MPSKKILHIINDANTMGGAEVIVRRLKERELNHEVFSLGINTRKISIYFVRSLISLVKLVSRSKDYDILHFHLFPAVYLSIFFPASKVVIHEHNTYNRRRKFKILPFVEKLIYKRAKVVICISNAVYQSLSSWLGYAGNLKVVNNFTRFETDCRDGNFKLDRPIQLLMVASFTEQKRQDLLLKLVSELEIDYRLTLIGDGPLLDEVQRLAVKLEINEKIFWLKESNQLEKYYSESDFCFLLSDWEGFGLVILEAASFCKPTFVFNVDGARDLVVNDNFVLDAGNFDDASDQILQSINAWHNIPYKAKTEMFSELVRPYSYKNFVHLLNVLYD